MERKVLLLQLHSYNKRSLSFNTETAAWLLEKDKGLGEEKGNNDNDMSSTASENAICFQEFKEFSLLLYAINVMCLISQHHYFCVWLHLICMTRKHLQHTQNAFLL